MEDPVTAGGGYDAEKVTAVKGDKDDAKTEPDESVSGKPESANGEGEDKMGGSIDMSKENAQSYHEDLFDRRRRWGKGISIYRLVGGKFQPKELDEEIKKSQQLEEERKRKLEEEEKNS